MLRWILAATVGAGLAGVIAAPAQAAASTPLTEGVAVTATVGSTHANPAYSFPGAAGQHVAFDISASAWTAGATLRLYDPVGVYRTGVVLSNAPAALESTVDISGTWSVVVGGTGASTGSATFTWARDVDGGLLTALVPVTATTHIPGQNAVYQFRGVKGRHVTFDVTAASWPAGGALFRLYDPHGNSRRSVALGTAPTWLDGTLDQTGLWRVVIDGSGPATGTITFTWARDRGPATLLERSRTVATTVHRGQSTAFALYSPAGAHVTIDVRTSQWTDAGAPGRATLKLYDPYEQLRGQVPLAQAPAFLDTTIDMDGLWTFVFDPEGGATGQVRFSWANDAGGRYLDPGVAAVAPIAYRGQRAFYRYAGTAGETIVVAFSDSSWAEEGAPSRAVARLYDPAGVVRAGLTLFGHSATLPFALDRTGTWRVVIDPVGATTGRVTLALGR